MNGQTHLNWLERPHPAQRATHPLGVSNQGLWVHFYIAEVSSHKIREQIL